jgi:endonuclease/exonuclease/phosphatase family protein
VGKDYASLKLFKTMVFNDTRLIRKDGRYAGYPHRTYAGGVYLGGFSDHFPVYIYLIKEIKK